jgi:hypothetical protein
MLELDGYGRRIQLERDPAGGGRAWYPGADGTRREATAERVSGGCDQPS